MNNLMSKIFRSSFINSIGLILLGILLIFQSEVTIVSISYIIGAIIIAFGGVALLKYIKNFNNESKNELDVIYGVVCVVLGIVVIKNPHAIASIIPFVIGAVIIINSVTKLHYGLELKKSNNDLWVSTTVIALITTICGLILIFNPFSGAVLITKIVGILILIYAILDVISTITIRKTVKSIHEAIEETVSDAEVVEETANEEKTTSKKENKRKRKNKKEEE